jgi:hypothetical protein
MATPNAQRPPVWEQLNALPTALGCLVALALLVPVNAVVVLIAVGAVVLPRPVVAFLLGVFVAEAVCFRALR